MKKIFFPLVVTLLIFACKPTQVLVDRPDAEQSVKRFETELSSINVPIRISVPDMEKALNKELSGEIYADKGKDFGITYSYKVFKAGNIKLELDGNKLVYTIPARIKMTGSFLGLDDATTATGAIKFSTGFGIDPDWTMKTTTKLLGFKVFNNPQFFGFSMKSIIQKTVARTRKLIEKTVDEEVAEFFPKKETLDKTWKKIQQPYLVSENYSAWLVTRPQNIRMTPLQGQNNEIVTNLGFDTYLDIKVGEKPFVNINPKIPELDQGAQGGSLFKIAIGTQIDYAKATEVLKKNFVGYSYNYKKKKKIVIRDIEVFGNGDKIVIGVTFDGNMEGKIYTTGTPAYDKASESIFIDNFEFDAKSKNALLNVAEIMVKGPFKKKMKEFMTISIRDELSETQKLIDEGLKENSFDDKLNFKCEIMKIEPKDILMNETGMQVMLSIIGESSLTYGKK